MRRSSSLFLVWFAFAGNLPAFSAGLLLGHDVESVDYVDLKEASVDCGPRSLYLLLRLTGRDISYGEVKNCVPVGIDGATLWGLAESANLLSKGFIPVKTDLQGLSGYSFPMIAHGYEGGDMNSGHYLVLLSLEANKLTIADPSRNEILEMSLMDFEAFWSGSLLVAKPLLYSWHILWGLLVAIAVLAYLRCRALASSSRLVSILLLLCVGCSSHEDTSDHPDRPSGGTVRATDLPLRISASYRDLGLVRLGQDASTDFTVSNVGECPITLSLGGSTCGCAVGSLGKQILSPGESSYARLAFGTSMNPEVGAKNASILLGADAFDANYRLEIKGVLEGLNLRDYRYVLESARAASQPPAIRGVFVVDATREDPSVQIVSATVFERVGDLVDGEVIQSVIEADSSGFHLGKVVISPAVATGSTLHYHVEIPVTVAGEIKAGRYLVNVRFVIGETSSDKMTEMLLIPPSQ